MACCNCYWTYGATAVLIVFIVFKYFFSIRKQKKLDKWAAKSQTKVILHGMYGNSDALPTVSPFVLKLETYLRLTNIPYEIDKSDIWGPKGKTPWISYKGKHLADSQLIIEYLSRQFRVQCNNKCSDKERALGTLVRVMVDEHFYWAGIMWRFAFGGRDTIQQVLNREKTLFQWLIFHFIAPQMRSMAWTHGLGRHSETEVIDFMIQDLKAISLILGNNKYLLGDAPTEYDCALFGGLASAVFAKPIPLLVQDELNGNSKNLKEYCIRIKDKFWPDWDSTLKMKQN